MNPRIQVEHTVTEMVTGIDIVKSQIRIAEGHPLASPGDRHPRPGRRQPARLRHPVPDHHRGPGQQLHARLRPHHPYRSAAGFGIRLDAGTAFTGAVITPFYDSLLVKVCASGLQLRRRLPQDGPRAWPSSASAA